MNISWSSVDLAREEYAGNIMHLKRAKKKNLVILGSACACVGMLVTKHTTIILTAVGSVEDYRFINELLIISF